MPDMQADSALDQVAHLEEPAVAGMVFTACDRRIAVSFYAKLIDFRINNALFYSSMSCSS